MNTISICIASITAGCVLSLSGCDNRNQTPRTGTTQPSSQNTSTSPNSSNQDAQRPASAPSTQRPTTTYPTPTTEADNTGRNREDGQRDARTPMDQSEASEHIKLTADVRRAVVADDTLSTGAKNCKIITDRTGTVWLRGVVESQAERELIERIARQTAGTNATVINELTVKTDGSSVPRS